MQVSTSTWERRRRSSTCPDGRLRVLAEARRPQGRRAFVFASRFSRGDPDAERAGSDDEVEWWGQIDRLAVHSGVDRRGRCHLESRGGPRPSWSAAWLRRVEDDDPELSAVECRPRAGCMGRLERVGVVRHEHDRGVESAAGPGRPRASGRPRRRSARARARPSPAGCAPWRHGRSAAERRRRRSRARRC